jgi:hypothetical protein
MANLMQYYYSHHWSLGSDTEFDGLKNRNPCSVTQELNPSANIFIAQNDDSPEVYPTSYGWAFLKKDSWVNTEWMEFANSHQFSIGFIVFPTTTIFSFEVRIQGSSNILYTSLLFTESYIWGRYPYAYFVTSNVQAHTWNKVFISFYLTHSYNLMKFEILVTPLVSSGDITNNVLISETYLPYSYYGHIGASVNTGFYGDNIILREVLYYRHAVNQKYLTDLGPYSYIQDYSFNFQQDFYDDYYRYFDNKPDGFKINNTTNA